VPSVSKHKRGAANEVRWPLPAGSPEAGAVLTLTYHGTHFYLLDVAGGKLLVDAGWPGSLPTLASKLKAYQLDGRQIKYVWPTHLHPDHAGLVQEVKQAWGTRLVIHAAQIPYLPELAALFVKKGGYVPIQVEAQDLILNDDNRPQLAALGLHGQIIPTPGHSDDSYALVLDDGAAFVGDLTWPALADEAHAATVRASWQALRDHGAHTIYSGHGRPTPIETLSADLDQLG
jgi:glyoxylase-like metal-dependent hydrolase (beta-lactamase superfamily II)